MTNVISGRQRLAPSLLMLLFIIMPVGIAVRDTDFSASMYYRIFGDILKPLFNGSCAVVALGLLRVVLISPRWISIRNDDLLIGTKGPIPRSEISDITVLDKKLVIIRNGFGNVQTALSKLTKPQEEVLEHLISWWRS